MLTAPPSVPLHLGSLHAYETVLLAILAFGPFVVLAVVVIIIRRRDGAEDEDEDEDEQTPSPAESSTEPPDVHG